MNVLIGQIIKEELLDLPYFDRHSGLVQVISKQDSSGKTTKFPVEVDLVDKKDMLPLIPDDSIKGLFYVEDNGMRAEGANSFTSDVTLVCWLCPKKISSDVGAVSTSAVSDIIDRLCKKIINRQPVTRLRFNVASIAPRDASIFAKYTYSETQTQYLMPPYDFFAIRLKAGYQLSKPCLEPLNPPEPC